MTGRAIAHHCKCSKKYKAKIRKLLRIALVGAVSENCIVTRVHKFFEDLTVVNIGGGGGKKWLAALCEGG